MKIFLFEQILKEKSRFLFGNVINIVFFLNRNIYIILLSLLYVEQNKPIEGSKYKSINSR